MNENIFNWQSLELNRLQYITVLNTLFQDAVSILGDVVESVRLLRRDGNSSNSSNVGGVGSGLDSGSTGSGSEELLMRLVGGRVRRSKR